MKSSLIYLGAALAQPLILFLIRKIGGAGMNSVQLPYFRMVHELDGRVRYFSELMKDREFCRLFDEKLNSLPGITGVRSNPLTGTSLVTHTLAKEGIREIFDKLNKDLREQFQSARKPSPVADLLSSFLSKDQSEKGLKGTGAAGGNRGQRSGLKDSGFPVSIAGPGGFKSNSTVRESFFDNMSALSRKINAHTSGYFDLASLIGIVLIARGLYKIVSLGQLPNGPQLVWWGYSLFRTRDLNVRNLPLRSQDLR